MTKKLLLSIGTASALAAIGIGTFGSKIHVTFGASDSAQYAESDAELSRAEVVLNAAIESAKNQELESLNAVNPQQLGRNLMGADALKLNAVKKSELQKIKSYKDVRTAGTFRDAEKMLRDRRYPIDEASLNFYKEIYTYKEKNKIADPRSVVKYFNTKSGLKEKPKSAIPGISFVETASAISYSDWTKLTTSEKLLIVSDPTAALITNSLSTLAFQWTQEKFGKNGLGDKSDGYRHGIWSALMTRDISRYWASAYATAHEDKSQAELQQKEIDGYYKYQHRNMDLNNNRVGRDQIQWYEFWFNCSDSTVKTRISNKLTNGYGGIYWLHL